jgi:MYXO-CTERM domain-containing protein
MPVTLTFGKDLELLHRGDMSALWSMKPVATAWTFSLEGVDGNGELVNNPYPYEIPIFDDSGFGFPLEFRRAGREDLCVVATVRDLKTGESVSEPICSTPGDMLPEVSDDQIRMCTTVPPELEERRCRALAGTSPGGSSSVGAGGCGSALPPGGAGGMPPSTAAGIGGMPPSAAAGIGGFPPSTAAGAGPNGPTPDAGSGGTASGGDDSSDEDDEAERVITRGCGCSVPERGRSDASMLALALLGAIAAFRRASSPSGIRSSRS